MNYKKHYFKLIQKAKTRTLPTDVYVEKHHIKPRCLGGVDEDYNLATLTPEEHYVAHQLLVKIYPNETGLVYAVHMMSATRKNNKTYGWVRRKHAKILSKKFKNRVFSDEHKAKISDAIKGEKHPMFGKHHTKSAADKIRQFQKGRIKSAETKRKQSESMKQRWAEKKQNKQETTFDDLFKT